MVKIGELVKKPEKIAFQSTLLIGFITHLFALTNVLHNYDSIGLQPYGYGTGMESGRWLINLIAWKAIAWFGDYNVPMINGLLMIFLLAVSAALFVSVYGLNEKGAFCVGTIFATAPAITSTMFFSYTAALYGLGILFAVLAVWFLDKFRWGFLLSVGCVAASMGIYQAYVPLTIGMFVLLLMQRTLRNETSVGKLILKGLYYCAAIAVGAMAYYGILQFLLDYYGKVLDGYQGINEMGQMSPSEFMTYVCFAVITYFRMPVTNYCGLAQTDFLKLSYLFLEALLLLTIVYLLATKVRKVLPSIFVGVLGIFFALAVDFIEVMAPKGAVYTIMVFPFVLVLCAPVVLWELVELPKSDALKKIVQPMGSVIIALVLFISFNYTYQANTNYTALYYANQKTENYLNSLVIQVRMTDGFTADKEWAFVGNIQDPMFSDPWDSVPRFGGNPTFQKLVNDYGQGSWVQNYLGIEIPYASKERVAELVRIDQVKAMPCWPDAGSIAVVDDTIVIKFQELADK